MIFPVIFWVQKIIKIAVEQNDDVWEKKGYQI